MSQTISDIQQQLFALEDTSYREFHARLMPTVPKDRIIGVRTPELRRFAKAFAKTPEAAEFLKALPHHYYEENNLHAFCLAEMKDFDRLIFELDRFLPYIDNWATCDMLRPKIFAKQTDQLLPHIKRWLKAQDTYTIRFGIEMLMVHFLEENFDPAYPIMVAAIRSQEYYINMMIAWYFATALAKQYACILPILTEGKLSTWVHNKTIQKAVESYRITPAQKAFLKSLKRI